MAETAGETGRTWRGQTIEERQADRRERLIEAGIELFGTRGYASTPVKAICDEAGLTERYFYEAFEDREDLLATIFELLVADCAQATLEAIEGSGDELAASMRAGLSAFAYQLTRDPRRARIQEIEVVGVSPAMEQKRRESIHAFAGILADRTRELGGKEQIGPLRLDVIALGLVGSVNEQLIDFVLGHLDISLEDLIENQITAFTAVAGVLYDRTG
jgi:AcrR family transcriptional regulator